MREGQALVSDELGVLGALVIDVAEGHTSQTAKASNPVPGAILLPDDLMASAVTIPVVAHAFCDLDTLAANGVGEPCGAALEAGP